MNERERHQVLEAGPQSEARATPESGGHSLLNLQRSAGNAAVNRVIQTKLTVGHAADPHEREADRVAAEVMRRIRAGASGDTGGVQRAAAPTLQMKSADPLGGTPVTPDIESRIAGSSGRPMDGGTLSRMEGAFGADLSSVRVHTGSEAATLSESLQATAFTTGNDVFFGKGAYDPGSSGGQELLAHELTHVVQQNGSEVGRTVRREAEEESAESETDEGGVVAEEGGVVAEKETEGSESETEEEGGEVISGKIPNGRGPEGFEVVKDPGEGGDRAGRIRQGPRAPEPTGDIELKLEVGGSNLSVSQSQRSGASGKNDALQANMGNLTWSAPGGKAVDAFGEESFDPEFRNASFVLGASRHDPLKVDFDLHVACGWGVNSGGAIDVPSGTAPVVTAATADQIVSDLTPELVEKSWRAPRTQYWSKAICERHEKFHSTDDRAWLTSTGAARFKNFINSRSIRLSSTSRRDPAVIGARVGAVLNAAIADLETANLEFYTGGAGSYLSYAGEERAFGDGKQPYLDLVAAVRAQGDLLQAQAEEQRQQALPAEERSVKSKAKFFEQFQGGK